MSDVSVLGTGGDGQRAGRGAHFEPAHEAHREQFERVGRVGDAALQFLGLDSATASVEP